MKTNSKRYWTGIEELRNEAEFIQNAEREFGSPDKMDEGSSRRDFLKTLGFGVSAVALVACESPVKKAIPYLNKPEDVEPTIANWYASTFTQGGDYCSILVKTREGRPIKIEGNKLSKVSKGGVGVRTHASLLSLYDNEKLKFATQKGSEIEWAKADMAILKELEKITALGKPIRIVSNTILSPSTQAVIEKFKEKHPTTQHISYDAVSASALIEVHAGVLPTYDFVAANVIVSLGADFQGTWISPTQFSTQWAINRKLSSHKEGNKEMSRHYQFETILSLSGSNADFRSTYKPSQEGLVVLALYNKVAALLGQNTVENNFSVPHLDKAAHDLIASKGKSLVICSSNDADVQNVVVGINQLLGNYGKTISLSPTYYRQGNDGQMNAFIEEAKSNLLGAVIFLGANPVYDHPRGKELAEALPKIQLTISTADRADETGSLCHYLMPDSHYLESWNDAQPEAGQFSLCQPTISTIFKTRQAQSSLLAWAGQSPDFYSFLKNYWTKNITQNWKQALHDGVFEGKSIGKSGAISQKIESSATEVAKKYSVQNKGLEVIFYEKSGIGSGAMANNPWLQEFPDPISKACWDNYAAISQKTAHDQKLEQGDLIKIDIKGKGSIELPILVQPGQANETIGIALGYGRTKAGKVADKVGANAYPLLSFADENILYFAKDVTISKTGATRKIAQTQTHQTVMNRKSVLQETHLVAYQKNNKAGRFEPKINTTEGLKKTSEISLWGGHGAKNSHSWGMVIDLNACNGCGACVVSCQSENNVPVVGRQEVINSREMHWIRIDRYYSSDAEVHDRIGLETASENPKVTFQPMMCQHCNNAPCETVCPVLATTHSSEGLNQMTYNRCIGTRYCANNCPYKVRRFNWFKYYNEDKFQDFHFSNDLGRMVINPDVTVRSRGVMEKCSMCVQRVQLGKLEAKKDKRKLQDGEIQTACSQSCPTGAIIFGDMSDPESKIAQVMAIEKEGRAFHVLEEINVAPQVSYLTKVRNGEAEKSEKVEHHS